MKFVKLFGNLGTLLIGCLLSGNSFSYSSKQDISIRNEVQCIKLEEKVNCDINSFIAAARSGLYEFYSIDENKNMNFLGVFSKDFPLNVRQEKIMQRYAYKNVLDKKINYLTLRKDKNNTLLQDETIYLNKNERYTDGTYLILQIDASGSFRVAKYVQNNPNDFEDRTLLEYDDLEDYSMMDEYDEFYAPHPFMSFQLE